METAQDQYLYSTLQWNSELDDCDDDDEGYCRYLIPVEGTSTRGQLY